MLDRRAVDADLLHLSKAERRALRALGVTIGAFCLYAADQFVEASADLASAFADRAAPDWRPGGSGAVAASRRSPAASGAGTARGRRRGVAGGAGRRGWSGSAN